MHTKKTIYIALAKHWETPWRWFLREPKHVGVFIVILILFRVDQQVMCISWILIKEFEFYVIYIKIVYQVGINKGSACLLAYMEYWNMLYWGNRSRPIFGGSQVFQFAVYCWITLYLHRYVWHQTADELRGPMRQQNFMGGIFYIFSSFHKEGRKRGT